MEIMPPDDEHDGLHVNPVDTLRITLAGLPAIATRIVLEADDLRRIREGEDTFWFVVIADHLHPMICQFDHPAG